jgi:drug/metabolite transporter (DMT)-like permease
MLASMNTAIAPTTPSPALRTAIALGTIYVIWSTTFFGIRLALDAFPPFLLGATRFLLAAALLVAGAMAARAPRPRLAEVAGAGLLGLVIVLIPNGSVIWAEQSIPTGIVALLGATTPLFVLGFQAALGARPGWRGVVGIVLGLVGVGVLVAPGLAGGLQGAVVLQAELVLASLVCAFGMVVGKRLPTPVSGLYNAALTMLAGGLGFLACAAVHGERLPVEVPLHAWGGLAYLVVFGSCLGFTAFTWLVQHARPTLVATSSYVNPVLAMLVGIWALHEPLASSTLIGAAVIVGSVVLVAGDRKN